MAEGLGDLRSIVGFELTDRGDRSTESREFCKGDGDSDSDLDTTLLALLTLGAAIDPLLGFSDRLGLRIHNENTRSIMLQMGHTVQDKITISNQIHGSNYLRNNKATRTPNSASRISAKPNPKKKTNKTRERTAHSDTNSDVQEP